jgi:ribosomal 50S subunit-recycling heat shock protein
MRLDRWLKISRILKRRTIAQMACEQGRVFVNERTAKPSQELKIGDIIHLELGGKALTVRAIDVVDHNVRAAQTDRLYEIIEEIKRPPEVLEWVPDEY